MKDKFETAFFILLGLIVFGLVVWAFYICSEPFRFWEWGG